MHYYSVVVCKNVALYSAAYIVGYRRPELYFTAPKSREIPDAPYHLHFCRPSWLVRGSPPRLSLATPRHCLYF